MASTEVFNLSSSAKDDTFGENSQYLELSENINKMFKTLNLDDSSDYNLANGGVGFSGDNGNGGGGSSLSSNLSTSSASSNSSKSSGGNNGNGGMNNNNEKLLTNGMNSMNVDVGNAVALSSSIGNSNTINNNTTTINDNGNGDGMSLGETNLNNALKGPLENSSDSSSDGLEQDCKICKNKLQIPRVLSCLHVFCESCLEKFLNVDKVDYEFSDGCGSITCPVCDQLTKVGNKGLESLHCDYIITNILDLSVVEPGSLACTSCTSKEKALSRCNECAHFLCSACDNAHKYMRCFENHEVVLLDELRKSKEKVAIHKPLFCQTHATENLKYYCFNCQVPVCNDCLIADHKGTDHHYELINDAEKRIRAEILETIQNAKNKIKNYDEMGNNLGNALNEIQTQHDTAQEMIEKTFENFKKSVEKRYEQAIANLEKTHSERELRTMDFIHKIEKCIDKIDGACTFTERVLNKANGPELLSLSRLIRRQFLVFHNTPKFECNFSLVFKSNFDKFEEIAEDLFGKIQTESTLTPKESTPPPTLPGMPPILVKSGNPTGNFGNNNNGNHSQGAPTNSVTASSPISLPTSMQSSFDGDISGLAANFMLPNGLTPDTSSHSTQLNNVIVGSGGSNGGGVGLTVGTSSNCVGLAVGGQSSGNAVGGNSFGVGSVTGNASVGGTNNIPVLSSIAEYNLHCLANLADATDMTNAMVAASSSSASPTQTPFTLADIISGDPRAFNNLKALAKIGMQNNTLTDLSDNSILARFSSPSMDPVASMLSVNDFVGLSSSNAGIGSMSGHSSSEEMGFNFPRTGSAAGRSKATPMQIRCKFGSLGASKGQFNAPHGFCLGVEEEIIVADTSNHRIEVFEKNGTFKFQFGVPGKEEGQLWYPRKVAVMRTNHKFVVCDRGNERSRMQLFTKNGHFIKKIAIRYIDIVAGLAITNQGLIVAVDSVSPTVFIINEEGDLAHWFDCSDHMREPSDIAIMGNDFYICDFKGHCVAVFKDTGTFLYRIGHEKITCFPNGIDISDAGDILIGDSHGNRFHVACFSRDGTLQSEYECPYVKVSRCCGLKITSEGYVVTLAKNNHHVLVLNTLYVQ